MESAGLSGLLKTLKKDLPVQSQPVYLIFGPEDHGLTTEDLEYANYILELPVHGEYKSMNLSHAVLLALHLFKEGWSNSQEGDGDQGGTSTPVGLNQAPEVDQTSKGETFYFPDEAIQSWLHTLGFQFGDRRTDVYKVLKRILLRNLSTSKELRVLEAVVHQTVRKLRGG